MCRGWGLVWREFGRWASLPFQLRDGDVLRGDGISMVAVRV